VSDRARSSNFLGLPKVGSSGKTTAMTRFLSNILLEGKWIRPNNELKQTRKMKHTNTIYKLTFALLLLLVINPATAGDKLPSGKLVRTDDEAVLTLPSGEKFVSKSDTDNMEDVLIFPNGQKFTSGSGKMAGRDDVPFVSTDGALVAIVRHPGTQTDELHIYFKDSTGKFKEIENVHEQVAKLLTGVKVKWPPNYAPPQKAANDALDLLSMSGHTLTLNSVSYCDQIEVCGHESKTYQFKVTVAPDGSFALAK
jgi:hypothetical protein